MEATAVTGEAETIFFFSSLPRYLDVDRRGAGHENFFYYRRNLNVLKNPNKKTGYKGKH